MLKSATDPSANVAMRAAAGTGKTWLLTSRLVSLLLRGAPPGSILAITFTRKAAAEIYRRLSKRVVLDFSDVLNRVINNKDACYRYSFNSPVPRCSASHDCLCLFYRDAGPRIADNS